MFSRVYFKKRTSVYTKQSDPNKASAVRLGQQLSKSFCPHWASQPLLFYLPTFTLDLIFITLFIGNIISTTIET